MIIKPETENVLKETQYHSRGLSIAIGPNPHQNGHPSYHLSNSFFS
jgi:hypothetical protein